MIEDWTERSLSDLCLLLNRGVSPVYVETGGTLVLNQKCVRDQRVNYFLGRRTDSKIKKISSEKHLQVGDILVNSTGAGTLGRVAQVNFLTEFTTIDSHLTLVRPDPLKVHPQFLGLALRFREKEIESLAEGSTGQTELSRTALSSIQISLPTCFKEQRTIAHILGTLDDKIELNRKQNATLEDMARAMFKAWFVDFEPVRAKMEGRWQRRQSLPGLPAHLFDLFPDRLVDSELGEIPEGWVISNLKNYSTLNPESWTARTRPVHIQYVDLSNTKWGNVVDVTTYNDDDAPSRAQRIMKPRDTIIGTVRPGNGSYAYITENNWTGSTGFALLRPKELEYSEFVYLTATSKENIERLSTLADGGAYPAVSSEIVLETVVPCVEKSLLKAFSQLVGPLFDRITDASRESKMLTIQRDTLLPKLISGELRLNQETTP